MDEKTVTLADAKARLSELTDRAAAGESITITKHGKPVALMLRAQVARAPIDLERLRRLTSAMPMQDEEAGAFLRSVREDARY